MNNTPSSFAVIFDMDGVLIDSPKLNWQANNEVLGRYGVHVPTDQLAQYLGTTLKFSVDRFNEVYGLNLKYDEFKAATDEIKKKLFADIQPKDGVIELLESLMSHNIPIAVATSMPRNLTEQRLATAGILHYFDDLVTEDDVQNHKPDPEVFLKAANKLGVDPSRCIVFEDAPAGVKGALAAGMICIAVQTTFVEHEMLSNATKVVQSLHDVSVLDLQVLV